MIFSMDDDSSNGDWTRFSTARTTPSGVQMPTVVEPSYNTIGVLEHLDSKLDNMLYLDSFNGVFD